MGPVTGIEQLGSLMYSIKRKVIGSLGKAQTKKEKKPYAKMDKSPSVVVEIRSCKARRIIDRTLQAADRPGKISIPL